MSDKDKSNLGWRNQIDDNTVYYDGKVTKEQWDEFVKRVSEPRPIVRPYIDMSHSLVQELIAEHAKKYIEKNKDLEQLPSKEFPGPGNKTIQVKINGPWYDEERNKKVLQDMADELNEQIAKESKVILNIMKEENKYYTPDIEEFYIGFECELMSSYGYLKGEWPNIMMEETNMLAKAEHFNWDLTKMIKAGTFRVKYLDQEDIESLGFKRGYSDRDGRSYDSYELITKEQFECCNFMTNNLELKHYYNNGNQYAFYTKIHKNYRCIFDGTIKNKSELKTILSMIGYKIENDDK